jgi:hypothetical protein
LKIYNLLGEEVAPLLAEKKEAGTHTIEWNAGNLPGGIYLLRLSAGEHVETKKLVLQR